MIGETEARMEVARLAVELMQHKDSCFWCKRDKRCAEGMKLAAAYRRACDVYSKYIYPTMLEPGQLDARD